jgi:hypothetical protein
LCGGGVLIWGCCFGFLGLVWRLLRG